MATIDSIQVSDISQNQICDVTISKSRPGAHRVKTVRMDFGGNLSLTKSGIWVYVKGSGKYRITKSTKQRDYEKAVDVAKNIHTITLTEGRPIARDDMEIWNRIYKTSCKNAKRKERDFSLSWDDMMFLVARSNGRCELTGIAFQNITNLKLKERQPFQPSIDRIDSTKGYVLDNCRLICVAANLAINSWGDWVLMELTRAIHIKNKSLSVSALKNRIKKSRNKHLKSKCE